MTMWMVGDRAFLVPGLATAPAAAYRQPECRVVSLTSARVEVELPGGDRLWTSLRNIAKRPVQPEPVRPRSAPAGRRLVLADDEHETTLW